LRFLYLELVDGGRQCSAIVTLFRFVGNTEGHVTLRIAISAGRSIRKGSSPDPEGNDESG
jgi:hypothetical protein